MFPLPLSLRPRLEDHHPQEEGKGSALQDSEGPAKELNLALDDNVPRWKETQGEKGEIQATGTAWVSHRCFSGLLGD